MKLREDETRIHYQGELKKYVGEYLPHWEVADGVYFVTFRLADSMPRSKLESLRDEYHHLMARLRNSEQVGPDDLAREGFSFFLQKIDGELDGGAGECWLEEPELASLVSDALAHFDGERYALYGWCVMPNHVHVTYRKHEGYTPERIHHSWKSYTGNVANRRLGRRGEPFWQADSYEHLVRTSEELARVNRYILANPAEAGLEEWPWYGIGGVGGSLE